SDMVVVCGCSASRSMLEAGVLGTLGQCTGKRPWLGPDSGEGCDKKARFLIRSASHAYFGHTLKVISIPLGDPKLSEQVTALWEDFLEEIESEEKLLKALDKPTLKNRLGEWNSETIWREMQRR